MKSLPTSMNTWSNSLEDKSIASDRDESGKQTYQLHKERPRDSKLKAR
jgi:hypothetical protein